MGLYKRKDSPTWWMSFSANGQQFQRSTGTTDKKLATAILGKVKAQIIEGKWFEVDEARKHTFDEMMDRFMREHAPTVADKTRKSYRNSQAHLREFFSGLTLDKIDPDMIMQYVVHRREQTCTPKSEDCQKCRQAPETDACQALREKRKCRPGTRNRELAMLSKAFNLARLWKWTRENPCELVKRENEDNEHIGQCLPEDKEKALLELCRPLCNGQLIDMVIVAVNTGLRESEVLGMQWDRIDFKARTITVIQKGNRLKVSAMNKTVCNLLLEKSKVRSISGYVFVTANGTPFIARNMYREFKKVCRKIGMPSFRFHDLRHTVGTRLAQAGHDLYAIASVLGHSQLSTAKRYAKHNVESLHRVVSTLDKKDGTNG
ncbi:MAG: tyrosine-type recombinase/integrase [Nitrospirota bacterium]